MLFPFMEGEDQGSEWPRGSLNLEANESIRGNTEPGEPPAAISSLSCGRYHLPVRLLHPLLVGLLCLTAEATGVSCHQKKLYVGQGAL